MEKAKMLAEGARRRAIVHEADVAATTAGQIQDRLAPTKADRMKFNLRLPPRYFTLLDTARARRAGRPSRNTMVAEAVENFLRKEGLL